MTTDMTGFRWFSKVFASLRFRKNSLSIGRVKFAVKDWIGVHRNDLYNQV